MTHFSGELLVRFFGRVSRRQPSARSRARRIRPTIEVLEGRTLPATFTVISLGDTGAGSGLQGDLRYCLNQANTDADFSNRIQFQPGLTGTITLVRGVLTVNKNLQIDGPGTASLTVSGGGQSGVFSIPAGSGARDVRILDLTIADGTGVTVGASQFGGGLYNFGAAVTLTRATFTGNDVEGPMQGVSDGGAIYNFEGTMVLNACTIRNNKVQTFGGSGGITNYRGQLTLNDCTIADNAGGFSAGVLNYGILTINHCTITGNNGGVENINTLTVSDSTISGNLGTGIANINGGAVITNSTIADNTAFFGGGIDNRGSLVVRDSTIVGNLASSYYGYGGGIENSSAGSLVLDNTTIAGNTASTGGGGIDIDEGSSFNTLVELTSCTITQNTVTAPDEPGPSGGGFLIRSPSTIVMDNTIMAGNTSPDVSPDDLVGSAVLSLGYNLIGEKDDSSGWQPQDRTGTRARPLDPGLEPLADNGGPTLTQAVPIGSPAFQTGDPRLGVTFDQRGTLRGFTLRPSIGAFSSDITLSFEVLAPAGVNAGEPFDLTVVALDAYGHRSNLYTNTVRFSSSDLDASLPADYQFTAADGGIHTFSVTLQTPGRQQVGVIGSADLFGTAPTGSADMDVAHPTPSAGWQELAVALAAEDPVSTSHTR